MARTKYYQIQSKYGRNWKDVHATATKKDATDALKSYRENDPRTQHRRVIRYEKAPKALGGARATTRKCLMLPSPAGVSVVAVTRGGRVVKAMHFTNTQRLTIAEQAEAEARLSCKFTARKK